MHHDLRLECLKLAHEPAPAAPEEVVERARLYADFVLGTKDAEVVRAARQLAEKVRDAA